MIDGHMGADRRVGRYQLIKRLAAGGMADLHLAQVHGQRGYERTVVIKTLRRDLLDEAQSPDLLIQEALIASRLRHDHIVEVIEVGEDRGTPFMAMEFVFGRDVRQLRDRCQELKTKIPVRHVVTILVDVLEALAYAHDQARDGDRRLQVVHRDISPQNIIVGFDGSVKLLDFGLAKANAEFSRTHAGVLKGKYAYMSPEQIAFKEVDRRTDLFSTGVVLWELLTGRRLFLASNDYETVRAVARCKVPFARAVQRDVPWSLSWVAMWALRRNANWRYQSADTMRDALLVSDQRSRDEARNALADWMATLFQDELSLREAALNRTRSDPPRFRQIRDAGFELLEEPTDPDSLRVPPMLLARNGSDWREAATPSHDPSHADWRSVATVVLSSRRVFLALLAAAVLGCAALGIYLGHRAGGTTAHGYIYIYADAMDVQVTVGGRVLGTAPIQRVPVLPGRHRVEGRTSWGVAAVDVTVSAGENRVVQLQFPDSEP